MPSSHITNLAYGTLTGSSVLRGSALPRPRPRTHQWWIHRVDKWMEMGRGILGYFLWYPRMWPIVLILCLSNIQTLVLFLFAPETYAPKILRDRALRLERATGKVYRFRADAKGVINVIDVLKVSLIRPWKFLAREPIVIALSLYTAIIYGVLYLEFEAYPIVFQELRGWNSGEGGLAFLGLLVGVVLSVIVNLVCPVPYSKGGQ